MLQAVSAAYRSSFLLVVVADSRGGRRAAAYRSSPTVHIVPFLLTPRGRSHVTQPELLWAASSCISPGLPGSQRPSQTLLRLLGPAPSTENLPCFFRRIHRRLRLRHTPAPAFPILICKFPPPQRSDRARFLPIVEPALTSPSCLRLPRPCSLAHPPTPFASSSARHLFVLLFSLFHSFSIPFTPMSTPKKEKAKNLAAMTSLLIGSSPAATRKQVPVCQATRHSIVPRLTQSLCLTSASKVSMRLSNGFFVKKPLAKAFRVSDDLRCADPAPVASIALPF